MKMRCERVETMCGRDELFLAAHANGQKNGYQLHLTSPRVAIAMPLSFTKVKEHWFLPVFFRGRPEIIDCRRTRAF